jgi:hypothetical protein
MKVPMKGKHKYQVYGEYGGEFTRYDEALRCAKEASKTEEYGFECEIWVEGFGRARPTKRKGKKASCKSS